MSSNLSLTHCKAKFFEVSQEERKVRNEHERLLQVHIDKCIERGLGEAVYTVPQMLVGAFPLFDVQEMTLWLLKRCRRGNLKAQLLGASPYVIRVWGWQDGNWLKENMPTADGDSLQNMVILPKSKPTTKTTAAATRAKNISTDQASIIAQRRDLSKQLSKSMSRIQRSGLGLKSATKLKR